MRMLPLRIGPGEDLRRALEAAVAAQSVSAAFVLAGIGSLRDARLRLAGADQPQVLAGDSEILTLSGSVSPGGSHLHAALAGADGAVRGGHLAYGSLVRTTAEVLLALLPDWQFSRAPDAATGYDELVVRPAPSTLAGCGTPVAVSPCCDGKPLDRESPSRQRGIIDRPRR